MLEFDPTQHRLAEPKTFDDFHIGDEFPIPSRTVTEAHFALFQALSGDNHPIHYDRAYCHAQSHPDILAHGFQVLAFTAAGAGMFPHFLGDRLIGFIEQSCRFLKPVYPGDTLYSKLTVTNLQRQTTTGVITLRSIVHNQNGDTVLDGEHKYLVRLNSKHE